MEVLSFLIPYILGGFILGLLLTVLNIVSRVGGWRDLEKEYAAPLRFSEKKSSFVTGTIRKTGHYGGTLTIGIDQMGMYMKTILPFDYSHTPLFFPWNEIEYIEKKKNILGSIAVISLKKTPQKFSFEWRVIEKFKIFIPRGKIIPAE